MRTHRAAYEIHVGPIPEGLTLDHLCCVKACCNPAHLEPVTALENYRRAVESGFGGGGSTHGGGGGARQKKTHCHCGVELTPETTAKGKHRCKPCWAAYMSEWNRKNPDRPRPNRNEYHRQWKQRRKAAASDARKSATGSKTEGGGQPGPAADFATHQLEGPSKQPLGLVL